MRRSFYFVEIRTGDTRHIQQIHIDHFARRSIFLSCLMHSLACTTPPPPPPPTDPRRRLYMLYTFIATCHCRKGILGLGVKADKNKLIDTTFTFPMTNVTILSIFHKHAQKEYRKALEMKSTSVLNSLALLLFEN